MAVAPVRIRSGVPSRTTKARSSRTGPSSSGGVRARRAPLMAVAPVRIRSGVQVRNGSWPAETLGRAPFVVPGVRRLGQHWGNTRVRSRCPVALCSPLGGARSCHRVGPGHAHLVRPGRPAACRPVAVRDRRPGRSGSGPRDAGASSEFPRPALPGTAVTDAATVPGVEPIRVHLPAERLVPLRPIGL